jgi:hypothetical protein
MAYLLRGGHGIRHTILQVNLVPIAEAKAITKRASPASPVVHLGNLRQVPELHLRRSEGTKSQSAAAVVELADEAPAKPNLRSNTEAGHRNEHQAAEKEPFGRPDCPGAKKREDAAQQAKAPPAEYTSR